jgi:hypothetical protein
MSGPSDSPIVREERALTWPYAKAPVVISAAGLALAIAATAEPDQGASGGSIARRLIIELPDWVKVVMLLVLGLAALLLLAQIVRMPQRRRKSEEGFELYREPPKFTLADYAMLALLAALPFAMAGAVLWLSHWLATTTAPAGRPDGTDAPTAGLPPSPPLQPPEALPLHAPGVGALLGMLAILMAVASVGLMLWLYLGDWWSRPTNLPPGSGPMLAAPDRAVTGDADDLLLDADPRNAIITYYRRFEAALAVAGVPRRPWQTPTEFVGSLLQCCRLPRLAVWELTRLYELARFSRHSLTTRERDAALNSLRAVKQALHHPETRDGPSE